MGATSGKKIFFSPEIVWNFFFRLVSDQYEQKRKKKILAPCDPPKKNLVKILGGVEIFSPESPENFFGTFQTNTNQKGKKFFSAICDPKMGLAEVYGKKYYAKTGQNFEKQKN